MFMPMNRKENWVNGRATDHTRNANEHINGRARKRKIRMSTRAHGDNCGKKKNEFSGPKYVIKALW